MACICSFLRRLLPALLACASALFPGMLAQAAEPHWILVSSSHFSVLTDADEKKGREVALRFEQMRNVFAQLLLKTRVSMPQPLEIVALKTDDEYARLAPLRQGQPISAPGFFVAGEDRNFIVLNLFEDESWRAVTHEFAHLWLNYNYPPTPGWFDEGFAEYFSSLRLGNKQAQIGGDPELSPAWRQDVLGNQTEVRNPPKSLTELLNTPVWLSMPDLFTMKHNTAGYQEGTHHTLFYAQSWIVVHYLLNQNKLPETGIYFDLVQNQKVPVEQAIQQAYGMTVAQFEQAVKDYFHSLAPLFQAQDKAKQAGTVNPGGQVYQFPTVEVETLGTSTQQVLDPEARAMLAEVMTRLPERRERAVKELNGITSQEKEDNATAHRALAWMHMERKEFDPAGEELARAAELDPKDPWVRYYLALVKYRAAQASGQPFQGLANMMQDLRAVLDWDPDFAEAYSMLAMARMQGGGTNAAMESMRRAIELNPRSEYYLLNMAQIYLAGKKWDTATALLDRLKGSQNPQIARLARKNLEDLPTLKKYGMLPQQTAAMSQTADPTGAPASQTSTELRPDAPKEDETSGDRDQPLPAEPQPDKRSIQFLKGKLVSVDCAQTPAAVLTVTIGKKTLKLRTENYRTLLLVGADEFSCEWKNRPVAVNYKPGGKADGDLVSVEVQ